MKIMKIYNTVYAFATNITIISNNDFKFYISKFFRVINFLSEIKKDLTKFKKYFWNRNFK